MPMYSAWGNAVLPALGFPIRESADHRLFSAYPRLIAAVHALHRLLVPRHPPCALLILTVIRHYSDPRVGEAPGDTRLVGRNRRDRGQLAWLCSFQGPRRGAPRPHELPNTGLAGLGRSLKTQQHAPAARRTWRRAPAILGGQPEEGGGRLWPADARFGRRSKKPDRSSAADATHGSPAAPILELP
jgi:hypothetical protein